MALSDRLANLKNFLVQLPIRSRDRLTLKEQVAFYTDVVTKVGGSDLWGQVMINPGALNLDIGALDPVYAKITDNGSGSTGVFAYQFQNSGIMEAGFSLQLPRSYKQGSNIYLNVHWAPATSASGDVVWQFESTWDNVAGTIGNSAIVAAPASAAGGTALKVNTASFAAFTGTGKTIASVLTGRIFRDPGHAEDTYEATAWMLGLSVTFQQDAYGSTAQWTK